MRDTERPVGRPAGETLKQASLRKLDEFMEQQANRVFEQLNVTLPGEGSFSHVSRREREMRELRNSSYATAHAALAYEELGLLDFEYKH